MEYNGKLYGKIGNKYFDTSVTSSDYDKLLKDNGKMLGMLSHCRSLLILCTLLDKSGQCEDLVIEIEQLIKEATNG